MKLYKYTENTGCGLWKTPEDFLGYARSFGRYKINQGDFLLQCSSFEKVDKKRMLAKFLNLTTSQTGYLTKDHLRKYAYLYYDE